MKGMIYAMYLTMERLSLEHLSLLHNSQAMFWLKGMDGWMWECALHIDSLMGSKGIYKPWWAEKNNIYFVLGLISYLSWEFNLKH